MKLPQFTLRDLFWLTLVIASWSPVVGFCEGPDWGLVVESLANRQSAPELKTGTGRLTSAPANYDWKEQDRILNVIQKLVDNAEEAWPALVEHCDDEQYCLTFHLASGKPTSENYSVGKTCTTILLESMTAAHMRHAPRTKGASIKLRWPDALPTSRRPADLKEWCQEQGKKKQPLYELQIEFCQWAIDNMPEDAENADKVAAAVAGLKSETKSLLANKKPVLMGKFTKTETRTVWRKPR